MIEKDYSTKTDATQYQRFLTSSELNSFSLFHLDNRNNAASYIVNQMGHQITPAADLQECKKFIVNTFFTIKLFKDTDDGFLPTQEKFNKMLGAIQKLIHNNADITLARFIQNNSKYFTAISTAQIKEFLEYLCRSLVINKNSNDNDPQLIDTDKVKLKCFALKNILHNHKVAQHFLGYTDAHEKSEKFNDLRYLSTIKVIFKSNNPNIIDTFLSNVKYAYNYEMSDRTKKVMKKAIEHNIKDISSLNLSAAAQKQLIEIGIPRVNTSNNNNQSMSDLYQSLSLKK